METHILSVVDSTTKIPFKLTYGIQKDLQKYLLQDDNLYAMFTNPDVAEYVYKLCLSKRDDQGLLTEEFTAFDTLDILELNVLLEDVFNYFENFFLNRQTKIKMAAEKLNQLNSPQ